MPDPFVYEQRATRDLLRRHDLAADPEASLTAVMNQILWKNSRENLKGSDED
ncbi:MULTISPECIES: hypothetical protein [unclassified Mycolicibacterium]|uniref:hypothetical protein n=1 Tax=unclassified Mycolicibacterium TaxID=2636767 RepID=UPI002ED799F5